MKNMQLLARHLAQAVGLLLATSILVGCAADRNVIGIDNSQFPSAYVEGATREKIFIASTREATDKTGALFSERRASTVGLASVEVSIPPVHVIGKLERAVQMPPDPRTEFAVVDPTVYATDQAFISAVNAELAKRPKGERNLMVFVHGYNNTTSDSVLRSAQFVNDSGYEGVVMLLDWASAGKLPRYVYDLNSTLVARGLLSEINSILLLTQAENYDIFAHSMGGFLTMEAIRDAVKDNKLNSSGKLQNVVLASPDIDLDLFRTHMAVIGDNLANFYVLSSENDRTLAFSQIIAGGVPRVGAANAEELAELGATVIDLTEVDDSSSGSHSKFAGSPEVVQLLGNGMNQHSQFDRKSAGARLQELVASTAIVVVGN
jgi:esterase/lipase superfamily enzyme